ncbi:hypothetical protein SY83_18465 [Paenibacillus swuensis]|uniref:DUF1405 domain-containing protein n=2 Tax=Paenibacillus swuensis TaxID=1178515 RepID=A0A172TQ25_9BACL|nr:hypothetical protein SY83_18465 [Paenibacillus swuensis]
MLWSLLLTNLAGTIYGYMWYAGQLEYTVSNMMRPEWQLLFVPDSPTASLFFTLTLVYLVADVYANQSIRTPLRGFIEAFALVTSFKYGIWAVTMIFAGSAQGDPLHWQDWMLTVSHLGMAAEVLLFARFYRYGWGSLLLVGLWTLVNDYMDYGQGLYPWLSAELEDNLNVIAGYTVTLTLVSVAIAWYAVIYRSKGRQ